MNANVEEGVAIWVTRPNSMCGDHFVKESRIPGKFIFTSVPKGSEYRVGQLMPAYWARTPYNKIAGSKSFASENHYS